MIILALFVFNIHTMCSVLSLFLLSFSCLLVCLLVYNGFYRLLSALSLSLSLKHAHTRTCEHIEQSKEKEERTKTGTMLTP